MENNFFLLFLHLLTVPIIVAINKIDKPEADIVNILSYC